MILIKRIIVVLVLVLIAGSGLYISNFYAQPDPVFTVGNVSGAQYTRITKNPDIPMRTKFKKLPEEVEIEASSVILITIDGDILFERNKDESLPVASMSKMMTELLVLEAIQAGDISWDQTVEISAYASTISNQPGFASVHLQQGQAYTVEELFHSMVIHSANGASIALAEVVAGTEGDFVAEMNEKAENLGLTNTRFVNSTGLDNIDLGEFVSVGTRSDTNRMSAQDVASLARHVIEQYPEILDVVDASSYTLDGVIHKNTNWMLPEVNEQGLGFQGVDGLKTGFTNEAGYCFAGTVEREDHRLISVVMGTSSITERFSQTKHLYESAFNELE
ncbi:D-alanyl-D-alanine carboxypeptidase [Aquibacillus koreensis]|uniref:D-alanyl-D-alanine carboxypeptidase n=1 Tax=Aquibacillus koreensis TaxID=279446 RepID=A0A9X3WPX7_9BACI|nr:D-alanyl-D-alanine carboxypeptidase family protein [Aquibacillus koreensis]MCT2535474.1 D-alanyl-D-alanine carboxypeptidase [Aquibacillus koreensis]MDC3422713.1 D-alanyl-D-alanine carboxypeptidase [Aquibacillus koreensis]